MKTFLKNAVPVVALTIGVIFLVKKFLPSVGSKL